MNYGTTRALRNALVVWGFFAAVGCDSTSSNERILPDSNGSPGELLVVADEACERLTELKICRVH